MKLWGYGAKLYSFTSDAELAADKPGLGIPKQALRLAAPGTAIYGFDLYSNVKKRMRGHPNAVQIAIESVGNRVVDNRVTDGHGIFVRAYGDAGKNTTNPARNFEIINNHVIRTWADAIHVTGKGTNDGLISRNFVRENGDDMIAIVEYGKGEPTINNIEISDNDVAGTYHGRGICVCGGRDIKVLRNKIDNILYDSGILLWADAGWSTNDVKRVLVEGNVITRIQTETAVYDPLAGTWANKRRGFAAIRLAGNAADRLVTDNIIRNNTIDRTTVDGIALDGNVCKTTLEGNVTKNLGAGRVPIRDMRSATCPGG